MSFSGTGQADVTAQTSEYNKISFLVQQALALVRTSTLVKVVAVTNTSDVSPIGTVDVLPLVNMTDGAGVSYEHITVHKLPYCRVQGGKSAVICDPCVNDIGVAVFADRDISVVKKTQDQSNPGSWRKHDFADGMYLFTAVSSVTPTQFVQFVTDTEGNPTGINVTDANNNQVVMDDAGISLTDKNNNTIVMNSDGITINGVLFDQSSNVSAIAKLTTTDTTSLAGGAKAVKLSDGSNATKVTAT
jgi:hypothetical protein